MFIKILIFLNLVNNGNIYISTGCFIRMFVIKRYKQCIDCDCLFCEFQSITHFRACIAVYFRMLRLKPINTTSIPWSCKNQGEPLPSTYQHRLSKNLVKKCLFCVNFIIFVLNKWQNLYILKGNVYFICILLYHFCSAILFDFNRIGDFLLDDYHFWIWNLYWNFSREIPSNFNGPL